MVQCFSFVFVPSSELINRTLGAVVVSCCQICCWDLLVMRQSTQVGLCGMLNILRLCVPTYTPTSAELHCLSYHFPHAARHSLLVDNV